MKLIINIFSFFLITSFAFGQTKSKIEISSLEYNIVELKSEYFPNENRIIKIFLPKNYDITKKHPVIYTLDGYSLFDLTAKYVDQLSKLTIENDYDVATDVIPQSIVVGIYHNNRNKETTPNFSKYSDGDETFYLEGSEKLKNFLFEEVVPYINTKYNTSGYNSIIGHSNTAHFVICLPFQKNNPFNGIISLSLSGESENFKRKIEPYLTTNKKTNIFIGYGMKDYDFNEFAKDLKGKVFNNNLKISEFNANHNEMPAISLIQGIKFLFNEYRNIEDFYIESNKENFDIREYLKLYHSKNKKLYGIETQIKEVDFYSLIQMSINTKNKKALNQIIEYDSKVNGYPTQTHTLFFYNKQIGDFEKANYLANKIMNSKDDLENRILNANLESYYDFYINDLKNTEMGIAFFQQGQKKFKDNQLEFSYFIAKASVENNTQKRLGKTNLEYCLKNYKENRYFREIDLKELKEE
ncbi:alpha/beta hydrolase [Polaribacter sp. L3A8]|uniref:alpha/beta hydrolase n=1 Tax=Polaribacter sp. L3A8 TaxID=2686361 RepID=UPI00131CBBD8|nr:alpha/beta hydrolase-fold protein [Polaribacter sp. L3A8]